MHYPLTIERQQAVLDGLARICGRRPVIAHAQQVGHDWAPVTRLVFDRDLSGLGAGPTEGPSRTVIVKTRRVDGEGHGGPAYLRREAAGLRTAVLSGVAARVILTDDQAGVVVQSDLGTWPTLETVLLGNDSERAATAMVDFAQTIGRLHATTLGGGSVTRAKPNIQENGDGTVFVEWPANNEVALPFFQAEMPDPDMLTDMWTSVLWHPCGVMTLRFGATPAGRP